MAKKLKRMSRAELREPDRVEVVLSSWWSHIAAYWKIMVAGCVGLLIAGGIQSFWKGTMQEADYTRSDALTKALNPLTSPLVEQNPFSGPAGSTERGATDPLVGAESFIDGLSAIDETAGRLDSYLAEHGDADSSTSIRYLRATLESTDAGARLGAIESVMSEKLDPVLQQSGLLTLAAAQADNGDRDKAVVTYQKAADRSTGAIKAMALSAIGDLSNPFVFGDGDAEKAVASYRAAKATLGDVPALGEVEYLDQLLIPLLHLELENKIAILLQ